MKTKTNTADPAALQAELERARRAAAVRRADELERERAQARHSRDRADVATVERLTELERARREAAAESRARLARLYEEALEAGTRTRIRSALARSGEARALNLERTRALNIRVLVPFLIGFGIWSTTGVQSGGARLLQVGMSDPTWWVLWLLEPILIGVVAWIIIVRARLAASGGKLEAGAEWLGAASLATSIVLNLVSAAPTGGGRVSVGGMLAHAIGPVGAAMVAYLIGVVDRSITGADPWTDPLPGRPGVRRPVPVLADLDLTLPAPVTALDSGSGSALDSTLDSASESALESGDLPALDSASESTTDSASESASESTPEDAVVRPVSVWPVPVGGRAVLPIVARTAPVTAPRTAPEQGADCVSEALPGGGQERPRKRPNKDTKVPAAALKSASEDSPRAMSDSMLAGRLTDLIDSDDLPSDPSVRQVQGALGIGFDRAKRVMAEAAALMEFGAMGGQDGDGRVVEFLRAVSAGGDR